MNSFDDLPTDNAQRALLLQEILIARATGQINDDVRYSRIRSELMQDPQVVSVMPDYVQRHRTLATFWPFIKDLAATYADRRHFIHESFVPVLDLLEGRGVAPADPHAGETLRTFDSDGVHAVWAKALERRNADPEGAITVARTLLEAVIKRILDERGASYSEKDDLPKLYGIAAAEMNLAPSQHAHEAIRAILGGATNVVNGIGTLRNKLSDAHGRGGQPVRALPRHASLAVNMAGTVATFLVETHLARSDGQP